MDYTAKSYMRQVDDAIDAWRMSQPYNYQPKYIILNPMFVSLLIAELKAFGWAEQRSMSRLSEYKGAKVIESNSLKPEEIIIAQ